MIPFFGIWNDWGVFAVRLIVSLIFIVHGWQKIRNIPETVSNFSAMGFKPGIFWGPLIAILEFFGGLALFLGFLTQPIAGLFVIEFITATIWRISKHHSFAGGYELDLLILAAVFFLFLSGAGAFSLDRAFLFNSMW